MNLDDAPYPWHLPVARDLHRKLIDAFFDPNEALELVRGAKAPNPARVNFKQDISAVWRDTLTRASAEGGLRPLLEFVATESAMPAASKEFIRALLANTSPTGDPTPTGPQGQPLVPFATREEALLFGDDLTESVGDVPALLESIARVMLASRSVCKLHVDAATGGTFVGTGTLLPNSRILTNHHVLFPDGAAGTHVVAEFDFELDAKGQAIASVRVDCDVATITTDFADDWGTIALVGPPPATAAPFDVAANHAQAKPSERAFIIQHPGGRPKRVGFIRNKISSVEPRRVFYLMDTEGGSSGSLVFNGDGKAVALHRAGGIPQKFTGMAPVKKNEGVRIELVVSGLKA